MIVRQCRSFSSSSLKYSILDYFRSKPSTPAVAQPSTKEVMKKAEQSEVSLEKIPIIGKRNKLRDELWKTRMNGFEVNSWIPEKSVYTELIASDSNIEPTVVIKNLLLKTYNDKLSANLDAVTEDITLNDLQKRFELIKQIQLDFGVKISDYELTTLNSLTKVEKYLNKKLLNPTRFNEKEPNAIYLDEDAFKGTNVSIKSYVSEALKEKKFNALLRQAKKLEKLENRKLLDSQLESA